MKRLTFTIGIVAHNEEATLPALLRSIRIQRLPRSVQLDHIIVISDGSTDATLKNVRESTNGKLRLIAHKRQQGKGARLNNLFTMHSSDILVLFDADIMLDGTHVLESLLTPFLEDRSLGLVCGNPVPLPSRSLAGRASNNWISTLVTVRESVKNGDNPYSACGPIMALSKSLTDKLVIPPNIPDDRFLYFMNKSRGLSFRYVGHAKVWFKSAENESELLRQGSRYRQAYFLLAHHLGDNTISEAFRLPLSLRVQMLRMQLSRDPVAYFYMKYLHMRLMGMRYTGDVGKWQPLRSSKQLQHLPKI